MGQTEVGKPKCKSEVLGRVRSPSKSPFAFLLACFFPLSGLMMCVEIFNLLVRQVAIRFVSAQWFYFAACWSLSLAKAVLWVACSAWAASRWQPHPLLNPGEWRNVSVSLGHWGLIQEPVFHFPKRERKHLVFHAVSVASAYCRPCGYVSVYAAFSYINDSKSLDLRVLGAELLDLNKNSWKGMLRQEKRSLQMLICILWFQCWGLNTWSILGKHLPLNYI